jgi:hypothetical protein
MLSQSSASVPVPTEPFSPPGISMAVFDIALTLCVDFFMFISTPPQGAVDAGMRQSSLLSCVVLRHDTREIRVR